MYVVNQFNCKYANLFNNSGSVTTEFGFERGNYPKAVGFGNRPFDRNIRITSTVTYSADGGCQEQREQS